MSVLLPPQQLQLLDQISGQPFHYLGSGKECYAFVSEDQQYVIKFFKQKHMRTQSLLDHFPLPYAIKRIRNETISKRSLLRNKIFSSYTIAYQNFSDETGLLFLHLNPTKTLNRSIDITTRDGKKHTLDMDKMEFLIQKRANLIFSQIDAFMNTNQIKEAKLAIGSILDLIIIRNQKGIGDDDINCERNLGLIGERAIQIDIGEFSLIPARYPPAEEFRCATYDLHKWLKNHHPTLADYLEKQIQKRSQSGV